LCSTSSTRSANCLDSAFLIRRYGSEQATYTHDVEPFAHASAPTSAQIWTRRTGGASSLREQLHHTRTLQQHELFRDPASPPASSLDGSIFGTRDGGSPLESASPHSTDAPSAREALSLRERLAALSPMTSQVHNELRRRVLGDENTTNVEPDLVRSLPHDTGPNIQVDHATSKSQWASSSLCSSSSPPPVQ
uniref:Uncharacterized protein n=1 Tax=Parascaris equorum TaxID=6256 RepID=A0A914RY50_PAREQ